MRFSLPPLDFYFRDATQNNERCLFEWLPQHPQLRFAMRREYWERGNRGGPNRHEDFFALYIVKSGRGIHQIDGTPYGISRGDVYLLAPGSTHIYLDYRDLVIDAAYFPFDWLESRDIEALRDVVGFWRLFASGGQSGIDRRLHLSPETHRTIEADIENLRAEYTEDNAAARWMLRAGFLRLLIQLARWHGANALPHETPRPTFGRPLQLAQVRRWCEENRGEAPSVSQLAAMMALSPSQFRAVWKRETGVPPALYLRRLRLERARARLDENQLSIAQIAREAGFCDAAHFSRSFRAVYGHCPRHYRATR
ncbi:MAG TPA: AraC family transcriptional regulator [Abditibacterium sp.]|jgi:AraC-like DNA-binding protein